MDGQYEVFREDPGGPLWIECVASLEQAKEISGLLPQAL
jgi:hypothetical protein